MTEKFDLIVIGAGTAGLTAATFAATLGISVALVEKHRIGGDCTWTGCVPSKALLKAARVAHTTRTSAAYGVLTAPPQIDMSAVRDHIRASIGTIYHHETPEALEAQGVRVILEAARFTDSHTLSVGTRTLTASKFIVATGAHPNTPSIPGLESVPYHTYETFFENDRLPEHLAIIGAGPIGVEMAQAYRRLGARVTLIGDILLPSAEPEARQVIETVLEREGVLHIHACADSVAHVGDRIQLRAGSREIDADMLLVATGRRPNTTGMGLAEAGVVFSAAGIQVDAYLRTSQRHIFAAGDCIGGDQFTHYAGWQAFRALQNAVLPLRAKGVLAAVPWTIFTDPEVAQAGLSEKAARARYGDQVRVSVLPMNRTDRAIIDGDQDGFIKLIHNRGGKLYGATVVAARAGEIITEFAIGIEQGLSTSKLAQTIHTYPTYATASQLLESRITSDWLLSGGLGRFVKQWARRAVR